MNFIPFIEQDEITVELKYCERCGGLFLRQRSQEEVYCGLCRARLAKLLWTGSRQGRRRRAPRGEQLQGQVQIECLLGVAELEVRP